MHTTFKLKRLMTAFALMVTALMMISTSAAQEQPKPQQKRIVSERELPTPLAISDALSTIISSADVKEVAIRQAQVPQSEAEWNQTIEAADAQLIALTKQFIPVLQVDVEAHQIAGVTVRTITPPKLDPKFSNKVLLHLHPGGYVLNKGLASIGEAMLIATRIGAKVISVDYRMPPASPYPAAVTDVLSVYSALLKQHQSEAIALVGSSAGGGLALAATLKFKEEGLPLPGAIFAGSPWADLTKTGDSLYTLKGVDRLLYTYDGLLEASAKLYAGKHDIKTPFISPLYGDFSGFPPVQLVTGSRDLFLSDTARTHRKMKQANVLAELNVYEGLSHVEYLQAMNTPESMQIHKELGEFLLQHLQSSD